MIPEKIKITESALAADGGSIFLYGTDEFENLIEIFLDWSNESQKNKKTQLYLNDEKIAKRSEDEEDLLRVLEEEAILGSSEKDVIEKLVANVKSDKY
ncbi:MAG: hypothetical protein JW982_09395 [Spirochaetes bacterium]|nr:hypothetical protein [Spirochaetota bacterium]